MSLESLDHIVSGVLFDFAGFLTSRAERITLSASDLASPAADAVSEFMKLRGVNEECPPFMQWNARCSANQNKPKITRERISMWISVNDKLPDPAEFDWVLVQVVILPQNFYGVPHVAELRSGKWYCNESINGRDMEEELKVRVSHWMPMLPPPAGSP